MNAIEKRKRELEQYQPDRTLDPASVDGYWRPVLHEYGQKPLNIVREPQISPFPAVSVDKLIYQGYDDTPLHGWFMTPATAKSGAEAGCKPPCVVTFPGYTGDRGLPERYAAWLLLGYAVLAVDARGQGGETGNRMPETSGSAKGWVSMGLLEKERSYYQAIALDVVGAVEAASRQPEIDPAKIAVVGGSQGGGIALLAGALSDKPAALVADIPNMCHLDYGIMHSTGSLSEIAHYLKRHPDRLDGALHTLAHFDIMNLAHRIKSPVMMSVCWKDTVCVPETIYAVYNRLGCPKQIFDYPFHGHEIAEEHHRKSMRFLQELFGC